MELVLESLRWVHILAGSVGLFVYWIPVLTRKGGRTHKRFGLVFKWTAYVVLGAAALGISIRFVDAAITGIGPSDAPSQFAFLLFLGYLSVVTWVLVRHGVRVLDHKADVSAMDGPFDRGLAWLSIAASVGIIAYALYFAPPNRVVLFSLSPVGFLIGKGILDVLNGKLTERNAWLIEHLGAMLGAGIAFHTAFAVFGLSRLFDIGITGWQAAIPWILPTLVGIPATALWTRKYQRKAPSAKAAA